MSDLDLKYLKSIMKYDPETGLFIRTKVTGRSTHVGDIAGTTNVGGYVKIYVKGRKYGANRLAWFYMTGEWPNGLVDHADGVTDNNRWDNLRLATPSQNQANRRIGKNNKSGFKGVSLVGGRYKWKAAVKHKGRIEFEGYYKNKKEAARMYNKKALEFFGEFAKLNNL